MDADAYNLAVLMLRVGFGLMMAAHGYNHFFRGGKIPGTGRWFESLGMKPGKFHAILASTTEIGAGLLFAVGLLTPLAAAGLVGTMVVAIGTYHRKNGFFITKEGWEYTTLIAVACIATSMLGAGEWSLDHALDIADDLDGWTGFWLSAGIGIGSGLATMAIWYRPPKPTA
jgi:putative oxidoreductase